jgi:hypothetical protein
VINCNQPLYLVEGTIWILRCHSDEPHDSKDADVPSVRLSNSSSIYNAVPLISHNSYQKLHRRFHWCGPQQKDRHRQATVEGRLCNRVGDVRGSRQVHLALNPLPDSFSRIWKLSLCSESMHRETFFWICNLSCRIGVSICNVQKLATSRWRFHCYVTSFHRHKKLCDRSGVGDSPSSQMRREKPIHSNWPTI